MPFLNRFVGNPILTGMLNVLFGVKVSDAHCGMRALRREALPVLDLHSTGMEFASEMVFKAYRRGLEVSEVPIDYYPRVGESKLNRFGDAWRHVRFMLLYSPSWLYLGPGSALLLLGVAGMLFLAAGPIDIFGHTWQIHTMLGFVAMTLIGAQVIQLGVFARTYARVRIGERDELLERLGQHLKLEHGLIIGFALALAGIVGLVAVGAEWAANGFGELGREYETALLVTALGLGIQIVSAPSSSHSSRCRCAARRRAATRHRAMSALEHPGYVQLNRRPYGGHVRLLELVGANKRVLDVGCSSGYLARPLVERGCKVVGIERDPDAAARPAPCARTCSSVTSRRWTSPSSRARSMSSSAAT